jgi:exportin-2 (importin alpha re-exporter)
MLVFSSDNSCLYLTIGSEGVMRVILTARQTLIPLYQELLGRLVNILGTIAKNPSNPNFDQYIFESISGLMRYVISSN